MDTHSPQRVRGVGLVITVIQKNSIISTTDHDMLFKVWLQRYNTFDDDLWNQVIVLP